MFLVRLMLRLVLLFLLLAVALAAWNTQDSGARLLLIVGGVLLAWGIYALRQLRGLDQSSHAMGKHRSRGWQLLWSDQTPFIPEGHRHPLVRKYPMLAPFYPLLSPGTHILGAAVVPVASASLATGLGALVLSRYGGALRRIAQAALGAVADHVFQNPGMAAGIFFAFVYFVTLVQFRKRVPARCGFPECDGHAFLQGEFESEQPAFGRRRRQYVYICREHRHRLETGVIAVWG